MGRHQGKNSSNNLKSNMVTPEPRGHTKGRLDHPDPEEIEENDFKCNLRKVMEIFKEEMENSLKYMEEKTNKNGRN